jgi:hypothetical protein
VVTDTTVRVSVHVLVWISIAVLVISISIPVLPFELVVISDAIASDGAERP